jgi:serine/threonine-protein kinase HipA
LTPLYDILSAAPFFDKRRLPIQKAKTAMAVQGTKKKYYGLHRIRRRHWISTAERTGFSAKSAGRITDELCDRVQESIRRLSDMIPPDFPGYIADGVFGWMRKVRDG